MSADALAAISTFGVSACCLKSRTDLSADQGADGTCQRGSEGPNTGPPFRIQISTRERAHGTPRGQATTSFQIGVPVGRNRADPGCAWVAPSDVFCRGLHTYECYDSVRMRPSDNRSKFNVALGIEAQGFCLVKARG